MFLLSTIADEAIWGGKKLCPYVCGDALNRVGHLYSVRCTSEKSNIILTGPDEGDTFFSYFNKVKEVYGWNDLDPFPITIALVDATQDLSVQVHPNDICALDLEGVPKGKNESFYFLESPNNKKMVCGCACVSHEELVKNIDENHFEEILEYVDVDVGDYVHVPSGTLHSLSAGSLVYEIEENCDYTYRVYDYNRLDDYGKLRQLHIDKAKVSIDINSHGLVRNYPPSGSIIEKKYETELLLNTTYYKNEGEKLECLTIIDGEISVGDKKAFRGSTIILEAGDSLKQYIQKAIVARII